MNGTPVLEPVRGVFQAVVRTAAPRAEQFDQDQWAQGLALVEAQLTGRPPGMRRQLVTFLRILNLLPVLRFGRTFRRLGPERRLRVLRALERSRILLLRRGVWGIRTLSFLAVYGQDGVRERIGYRADPRGWDARPGAVTAATHGEGP